MPIFARIQNTGRLDDATMFETFNMGVGFCLIVPPDQVARTQHILGGYRHESSVIGHVVADTENTIQIPAFNLVGRGKRFTKVAA